jgi:hypothetical protein
MCHRFHTHLSIGTVFAEKATHPVFQNTDPRSAKMNAVERAHPLWTETFSDERREQQLQADSNAWRAVTGILMAIVSGGVCLAILTAWICLNE